MSASHMSSPSVKGHKHSPAYDSGFLPVGEIHKIYYEQYGKQDGKPVLFLHGGPGGSTSIASTVFFDPAIYRVILLDQRGCGKSLPCAELRENTTAYLLSDLEFLRGHLNIPKWHMVFGGSWGSALSLLYAQANPDKVGSLVLRGIFTATKAEFDFSRGPDGSARLFPELFDEWTSFLPLEDRDYALGGYYKLVTCGDPEKEFEAAKAYNKWELAIGSVEIGPDTFAKLEDRNWCMSHARLECHYHTHYAMLEPNQIMRNLDKIKHIPCSLVQGRFDIICTPRIAWELHKAWPETDLFMIPLAGHSANEPGIRNKLVEVCDKYAQDDYHL